MSLADFVSKCRLVYHLEAVDINNALNQLNIIGDDKAEEIAKKHVMTIFNDILPRLYGKEAVDQLLKKKEAH